ncbi:MAG: type IV pilin biogenesis protein [bacterium ADurb.Bin429]|nr:MAG: type IV pilin biogenesis protein [bacterium ADurb.Bin429]
MMRTTTTMANLALMLFTRQFTVMVNAGASLVRCLAILEDEAPRPYAEAAAAIRDRVEKGASLAKAIEPMPDLFPQFYLCMIRSGEIGGVLDLALNHLTELLHDDWSLSGLLGTTSLLMPDTRCQLESWDELSAPRRAILLSLFCRAYGMMLTSGVPIAQASLVAADFLPSKEREAMHRMVQVMREGENLEALMAELTFLPPIARGMYRLGTETGTLDTCLLKLGDLYRYEVMYQRALPEASYGLFRFTPDVVMEETMECDQYDMRPIQRMVNVLLEKALKAGADTILLVPDDEKRLLVQYGIAGEMQTELHLPMFARQPLWQFLRVWTNTFDQREGHIRTRINGRELDVCIVFATEPNGESVTITLK